MNINDIPATVTVSCPEKKFQQRYVIKGCINCEHFKGVSEMSSGKDLKWHERYVIRCSFPMTRRCADMSIVEE